MTANVHVIEARFKSNKARKDIQQFDNSMARLDRRAGSLGGTLGKMSGILGGLSFAMMAFDMGRTIIETEKMKASLQTMVGSVHDAELAFGALNQFAKETPFTMDQSVQAFIKMKSLGLEPTAEALKSFGNTASAMGKDMNQMIEAVADASTGEFERLKEFGIKAKSEGDNVSFVFQGVTTTVKKEAAEITEYLQGIGEQSFGDAMALQMDRLPGKISNLQDNIANLWRAFGDAGVTDAFADIVESISEGVETLTTLISTGFATETLSIILTPWVEMFGTAFQTISEMWAERGDEMMKTTQDLTTMTAEEQLTKTELVVAAISTMPKTFVTGIQIMGVALAGLVDYAQEKVAALGNVFDVGVLQIQRGFQVGWENVKLKFIELMGWFKETFAEEMSTLADFLPDNFMFHGLEEALNTAAFSTGTMAEAEKNLREEMAASASAHADKVDALFRENEARQVAANSAIQAMTDTILLLSAEEVATKKLTAERILTARSLLDGVKAGESYEDILNRLAKGGEKGEKTAKDMTKAWKELGRLKAIIDPSQKAVNRLTKEMDALNALRKEFEDNGQFFGKDFWDDMAAGLEQAIMGSETLGESMQRVGDLAGGALREIQSSLTDGSKAYEAMNVAIQAANVVQAVGAVLAQGQGDPYTAFARMAAMAAAVASLGVSIGGFQGGFTDTAAKRQAAQGTGSVLGDSEAKSESIRNAVEITADATSELVGINKGMLYALQSMQAGIGSATGKIARGGNLDFGELPDTDLPALMSGTWVPLIGNFFGGIANAILGGKSKVTDEGIAILGGSLQEMIDGTLIGAFQEVQYKKWRFGSKKTKEELVGIGNEAAQQIGLVFEAVGDAVREGALALGLDYDLIQERLESFRIEEQRISLKDLTGEEQQAEIEAVFSKIFDDLAGHVVPFIDQFQQVGEGLGETLVRVATSVQVMQEAITQLGWSIDVVDPEEFAQISVGLIEMAGGIDSFIGKMQGFVNTFATDEHKFSIAGEAIHKAFAAVGLTVPDTAAGMWELMESLDATTEEGQRQITTLLDLTDHAKTYYDMLDEIQEKHREALEEQLDYIQQIDDLAQAVGDRFKSLQDSIADFLNPKTIDDSISILDDLMAQLSTAETGGEIDRITAEMESVARSAWGALPDDMKKAMGDQFIEMLGEGDRLAQERLSIIRADAVKEADILQERLDLLMEGITAPFLEVIENLETAGDTLNEAGENLGGGDTGGNDSLVGVADTLADEGVANRASQERMAKDIAAAIASIPSRIVVNVSAPQSQQQGEYV